MKDNGFCYRTAIAWCHGWDPMALVGVELGSQMGVGVWEVRAEAYVSSLYILLISGIADLPSPFMYALQVWGEGGGVAAVRGSQ